MDTFKSAGNRLNFTAGADYSSGDVVEIGTLFGIIVTDIDYSENTLGAVEITGVHELDALTAGVWSQGDQLYWDDTNDELTDIPGGHDHIGIAAAAKINATTVATVLLNAAYRRGANEQHITATGAIDPDADYVTLDSSGGALALTIAAPNRPGHLMVIEMTTAGNNGVLTLTSIVLGGTAATSATFDGAGDTLVIVSIGAVWVVLDEHVVVLS